jgi:hypothetical protein
VTQCSDQRLVSLFGFLLFVINGPPCLKKATKLACSLNADLYSTGIPGCPSTPTCGLVEIVDGRPSCISEFTLIMLCVMSVSTSVK